MGASDWVETAQLFPIGGTNVLVRRLGKVEIFGVAEAYIIEQELRLIQQHAASMPKEERDGFIDRQHAKLPRGVDLTVAAATMLADGKTPDAVLIRMAEKAVSPPVDSIDMAKLFESASGEELGAMMRYIFGMDKKKL